MIYSLRFGEGMVGAKETFTTYAEAKKRYDELKNNKCQWASLTERVYTKGFLKKEKCVSTLLEGYNLFHEGKW